MSYLESIDRNMSTDLNVQYSQTGLHEPGLKTIPPAPTTHASCQTESSQSCHYDWIKGDEYCTPHVQAGYKGSYENETFRERTYYRITLIVYEEQEHAIIDLFKDRQWIYMKLASVLHSTIRYDIKHQIFVSDDRDNSVENTSSEQQDNPVSNDIIENLAVHGAVNNPVAEQSIDIVSCDPKENCYHYTQNVLSARALEKQLTTTGENHIGEGVNDLSKCNLTEDDNYFNCQKDALNETGDKNLNLAHGIFSSSLNERLVFCSENIKGQVLSTTKCLDTHYPGSLAKSANKVNQPDMSYDRIKSEIDPNPNFESDKYDYQNSKEETQTQIKRHTKPCTYTSIYCKDCHHTFMSKGRYDRHLKEDNCKHICEVCSKVFLYERKQAYQMHIKYHKKQKDEECTICGKLFIEKYQMKQHEKSHALPKPMLCDKCGKSFPNTTGLRKHKANVHVESREKIQCSICAKLYSNMENLQYHIRSAHDSSCHDSFSCSICNKTFKHKRLLKVHEQTHRETRDFKCDKCDATFKRASDLSGHNKRHEKAYKHFCKFCNKGFYQKHKVQYHENIHTGAKPFECSICDFRCAFKENLSKHRKIHRDSDN